MDTKNERKGKKRKATANKADNMMSEIPENIQKLIKDMPEVEDYINTLLEKMLTQEKMIDKLREIIRGTDDTTSTNNKTEEEVNIKLEEASTSSSGLQTDDTINWENGMSLADQVREVAENVIQESGFVYHESLGLYFDKGTGYYYDQNTGLYYDGVNKTYYTYDETSQVFNVYHQVEEKVEPEPDPDYLKWQNEVKKWKRECRRKARARKRQRLQEEGECSDTDDDSDDEIDPCLRLMVLNSQVKDMKTGSLTIFTVMGGTIGREGDSHVLCIPDINVSKHHASITYRDKGYYLKDLGSRNGTYLDNERLSVAMCESEEIEITHGSEIKLGSTILACHIHPGTETCEACEPGLTLKEEKADFVITDKDSQHKEELLRLKRRFALSGSKPTDPSAQVADAGYQDRADQRRKTVGSLHHGEKTESASLEKSVPESNKGFKMLAKMGWQSGQALGKDGTGNTEPVPLQSNIGKAGLGADVISLPPETKKSKRKQESWAKARDRFQNLPDSLPKH